MECIRIETSEAWNVHGSVHLLYDPCTSSGVNVAAGADFNGEQAAVSWQLYTLPTTTTTAAASGGHYTVSTLLLANTAILVYSNC